MHINYQSIRLLLGGSLGGILGGLIGLVIVEYLKTAIGVPFQQRSTGTSPMLLYWGVALGLWAAIAEVLRYKLTALNKKSVVFRVLLQNISCIVLSALTGFALHDSLSGGAVIGLIFGFSYICFTTSVQITKKSNSRAISIAAIISLTLGGALLAGITGGLWWGISANGAQAEGYVLLVIAILSLIFLAWTFGIATGIFSFMHSFRLSYLRLMIALSFLIAVSIALMVKTSNENISPREHFRTIKNVNPEHRRNFSELTKLEVVDILKSKKNVSLIEYAALYQLTGDVKWAKTIKDILLLEEATQKFTNPAHSIKSTQMEAAARAICFNNIQQISGLFTADERKKIHKWFKQIVERIFTVEWVDYLYAFAFNRKPHGPYENQEIGVAALSVFSNVIEEEYPDLAERCRVFIDDHAVGWGNNFRNTDDNINYQAWWIYSCFATAKYRPINSWLRSKNANEAFYWILAQWPPHGLTPGYNEYYPANLSDAMALGASLFHDAQLKWLAIKILQQTDIEKGIPVPFYFGLSLWDDALDAKRPELKSKILKGPGGLPHEPGPNQPDKIVFRDGWDDDSLFALLNLRFSGWHRYKATNSFVNISHGKPFVVEDMIAKRNEWLPSGRAIYRDKKIDRIRLNGFQVGLEDYEKLLFDLLQVGSKWAQDPPRYCGVEYFNVTDKTVFSKTTVDEWREWTHNRVSLLESGKYFIVFDRAISPKIGTCAISWHFRGKPEFGENSIILSQEKYKLGVYYPHQAQWYDVVTKKSYEKDPPAVEGNSPDLDMYMSANGVRKAAFITAFIPEGFQESSRVELMPVFDESGNSQYPNALGMEINNNRYSHKAGVAFIDGIYHYGETIETDAKQFVLRKNGGALEIDHYGATFFLLNLDWKPANCSINGKENNEQKNWKILKDGRLLITLDSV